MPRVIRSASIHHLRAPMQVEFGHARASRKIAENILVVVDVDGVQGIGECVPREYVSGETEASVWLALSTLDLGAVASSIDTASFASAARSIEALDLPSRLRAGSILGLAATAALELALLDALGKRHGKPLGSLARELGLPDELCGNAGATHPLTSFLDFKRIASAADLPLCAGGEPRHLKIKVGLDREQDIERVSSGRQRVGPVATLSVDANMGWTLEQAVERVRALQAHHVDWYEEPLARGALQECQALRSATGAKVMLDESLCSFADGQRAIATEACDLFNIRLSKCGGFIASLRLAQLAYERHLGFQIGVHVGETGILCAAGLQLAAALRGYVSYEGGAPDEFFEHQLVKEALPFDRERCEATDPARPGLGVTLVPEIVDLQAIRTAHWLSGADWKHDSGPRDRK